MGEEQLHAKLSQLQAQLADLQQEVADLRTALAHVRTQKTSSMRERLRCPQCDGCRVFEVTAVNDGGGEGSMCIARAGLLNMRKVGQCSAYICEGCGLIEWYAQSPDALKPNGKTIFLHENKTPTAGAYR